MREDMSKSEVSIRKAELGDYYACLPLLAQLYHDDIGPDFKNVFERYVTGDDNLVLVAESKQEVVGVLIGSCHIDVDWEGRAAKVDAIVVSEKHRRTGVGKLLIDSFVTLERKHGCKAVRSRVNGENIHAQRFHERLGFSRADTYEYLLEL